jgi:acyl-CoA reductase-like NAD-dependent aldehyde dehydrogenase
MCSLAPALGAGCTAAVILPKETAQVNALISEVISDTDDLPRVVVNILTSGREGMEYLVETPDVPVISFTGSTRTGRSPPPARPVSNGSAWSWAARRRW